MSSLHEYVRIRCISSALWIQFTKNLLTITDSMAVTGFISVNKQLQQVGWQATLQNLDKQHNALLLEKLHYRFKKLALRIPCREPDKSFS